MKWLFYLCSSESKILLLRHHTSVSIVVYNRSPMQFPRLDLPGFWHGTETKRNVWLLWTCFGIAPVNKLVSLTWILWALRSFQRFTLHYKHALYSFPSNCVLHCLFPVGTRHRFVCLELKWLYLHSLIVCVSEEERKNNKWKSGSRINYSFCRGKLIALYRSPCE